MDRRAFLQRLGLVAAAAATPKFIFDMGANLYRYETYINTEWITALYEEISLSGSPEYMSPIVLKEPFNFSQLPGNRGVLFPRRFKLQICSGLVEIPPFITLEKPEYR